MYFIPFVSLLLSYSCPDSQSELYILYHSLFELYANSFIFHISKEPIHKATQLGKGAFGVIYFKFIFTTSQTVVMARPRVSKSCIVPRGGCGGRGEGRRTLKPRRGHLSLHLIKSSLSNQLNLNRMKFLLIFYLLFMLSNKLSTRLSVASHFSG